MLEQSMLIKKQMQDLLSLELHNFNSEDKSSFKELRDFFMQAPVPLAILKGPEYFFTLSNFPYETLIGRKAMGKNISEVFAAEEIKFIIPLLEAVYKTGVPYIGKDIPFNLIDLNGLTHNKWIDVAYHPFRENDEEEIKGIFAVFQDVTDRVIAKKIMAKSEEKFKQLANTLPQMVWTASDIGKLDWYNDIWFEYVGGERNQVGDDTWTRAIHPEDLIEVNQAWSAAINTKSLYRVDARFKHAKTGEYRWHLCQGGPIFNELGEIEKWTGTCSDIHEQRIARELLELERDVRERVVMALTHDLRTPLAAAKISAQLLMRKVPDELLLHRVANRISNSIDRADKMIQDILDASQIKAGEKISLDIEEHNLKEIMYSTYEDLAQIHGERIVFNGQEEIHGYWDASALKRMTENLINNAVKYGKDFTPITLNLKKLKDSIVISVHNEGTPISDKDQKAIFEPYNRTASANDGKQKGWGIGLTLVRGFALAHGGQAIVRSSLQDGTTFSIIIPQDSRNY
jgi:PAS domain S-box-containing protein